MVTGRWQKEPPLGWGRNCSVELSYSSKGKTKTFLRAKHTTTMGQKRTIPYMEVFKRITKHTHTHTHLLGSLYDATKRWVCVYMWSGHGHRRDTWPCGDWPTRPVVWTTRGLTERNSHMTPNQPTNRISYAATYIQHWVPCPCHAYVFIHLCYSICTSTAHVPQNPHTYN